MSTSAYRDPFAFDDNADVINPFKFSCPSSAPSASAACPAAQGSARPATQGAACPATQGAAPPRMQGATPPRTQGAARQAVLGAPCPKVVLEAVKLVRTAQIWLHPLGSRCLDRVMSQTHMRESVTRIHSLCRLSLLYFINVKVFCINCQKSGYRKSPI
jgi:hypothetical protein